MFDLVQHRKPVKFEAFIMIIIVFFMLGYPMIGIPNMVPHIPVLITIIFLLLYGTINKVKFSLLQESMIQSVSTSMGAIFLFFFKSLASICITSAISLFISTNTTFEESAINFIIELLKCITVAKK